MQRISKKITQRLRIAPFLVLGFTALMSFMTVLSAPSVSAVDPVDKVKEGVTAIGGGGTVTDLPDFIAKIINVLLFIVGAIAVVYIIIGAVRYVTSNGEQSHVKAAKDTILYAIIGLIVAILAFSIVKFVTDNL